MYRVDSRQRLAEKNHQRQQAVEKVSYIKVHACLPLKNGVSVRPSVTDESNIGEMVLSD